MAIGYIKQRLTPVFQTRAVNRINKQRTGYGTEDNFHWTNKFMFIHISPLSREITEPIRLVLMGLMTGQWSGRPTSSLYILKLNSITFNAHLGFK